MKLQDYEKKHIRALRNYLGECTVLLKSNGDFPLDRPEKIAAYGSGVRKTIKGGTGSGEVNSRYFITVERALEKSGFEITTRKWLAAYETELGRAKIEFKKTLKKKAKEQHTNYIVASMGAVMPEPEYELPLDGEGNTAIYVLSRISGEGNDREVVKGDLKLSDTEIRDILACQKKYERFMLVLNTGGVVDLSPVIDQVDNILILSQLGVETGSVLAKLLLGKIYPSGKLSTTWSRWEDYCRVGEFGDRNDTRYKEGIYVGYRYFDTVGKRALFPFGFGLSYTVFDVKDPQVTVDGELVTVTVKVENTGIRPGKEVVQVYVSLPDGKLDQPYQMLAGFAKTPELLPDGCCLLSVSFKISDLAGYDEEKSCYLLEAGDYVVRVGTSSVDTFAAAVLCMDEKIEVRKVVNLLGTTDFKDYKPKKCVAEIPKEVPRIKIASEAIAAEIVNYNVEHEINPMMETLGEDQLIYMNIGNFDPKKNGIASVIGDASQSVAGAAGETTTQCSQWGIPSIVMSDGPAGIRISRQFVVRKGKIHSIGSPLPETIAESFPKWINKTLDLFSAKPKKGEDVYEQYCTAIPIGTAIAQSFNTEFAEICGDIVGAEMERFGIQLWLAPALNIHRSVLCGRNFEYYSEDPYLSGKIAAAMTKGVQAHPGCGVTIKHYAANNQETNRYCSNSMVSERAMREIYLKGFEICVKEAAPAAVMTSYNLLNGTHTSEHRGLNEGILRNEFGHEGIIMTDWVTGGSFLSGNSKHRLPDAALVAASGNDLFMPGGKADFKQIKEGLASGKVTRKQLEINASRVLHAARVLGEEENEKYIVENI